MGDSFVHLHLHTEFSMLDGAARVSEVIDAAVADGQPAGGSADHGNMYGVLDFYKACHERGVKPIIGMEAYMAGESRFERPPRRGRMDDSGGETEGGKKLYYHLTLLAENQAGYKNLIKLASLAFLEGYYYQPRVDWELLERHHEGLIATTGCLGGHVLQSMLAGDSEGALGSAARLRDIFGPDHLFVELQDHGIPAQRQTMGGLLDIAKKLGSPVLATNDSHYVHRHDAVAHDALLCVQTGTTIDDPKRFKFEGEEHYLKSAQEMRGLFRERPDACDNTLWVAERADVQIEFGKPQLPAFPIPEGFTDDADYLRHLAMEGAHQRWGEHLHPTIAERLAYELQVITDMGFAAYFLICWDLIKYAREHGIRVGPGRGSAAGCAIAYCLRITDLDPIKYDLLFERFLNPGRIQMPDIDMDFDDRYRDEMIRYASERYGRDHVAQIVTFSKIKARAAVRDAARVLGYPYAVGDKVAKAMPPLMMGRDTPLHACFELDPKFEDGFKAAAELREMYAADPDVKKVVDVARGLEGLRRQAGIHASAVVITRNELTDYLPLQRRPENGQSPEDAPIVTQYEMHGVEDLGLLKMDFLGLRNLSVIEETVELIYERSGVRIDVDAVPLDDEETFKLLQRGDSIGVFQLEGGPMRSLMRALAPTTFDDVCALIALYRPGPMAANMHTDFADIKNGRKPITHIHPDMEEVLPDTYGLMVYQESILRVAQRFGGYSLAEADNLRKACGKKIRELMVVEREKFIAGCVATGYGEKVGKQLFDIIEPFADYAFGKSHSYGYGFVAYQTAWLKAHHPVEYLAALLTSVKASQDKAGVYLAECRQMGIKVLVPDVNVSSLDFTALGVDDAPPGLTIPPGTIGLIPFGLSAVRNVGENLVRLIIDERDKAGPFVDFYDFCERVEPTVLNKRAIESLVKAGAFDSLGHPRRGLLAVYEQIVDVTLARRRERDQGVMSLFGEGGPEGAYSERVAIPDLEFDKAQRLKFEKEMLGLYVSDHPLMGAEGMLRRRSDCSVADVAERADGDTLVVGGVITNLARKYTKKGDLMAVFTLEDLGGSIEVMVFPKVMSEQGFKLADDALVLVKGRVDGREDVAKLMCLDVTVVEAVTDARPPMRIRINPSSASEDLIGHLKRVLLEHPGETPVMLHLGEGQVLRLPAQFSVDSGNGLAGEIRVLLGPDAIVA